MTGEVVLTTWVVYWNPTDHPGRYVVRAWHVVRGIRGPVPAASAGVFDTIEQARRYVPPGLYRIMPSRDDDPVIAETWL